MTPADATTLRKGDRIRVTMATRRRSKLAIVTAAPHAVDRWTLVTYAYVEHDAGPGVETISRHDHVAQVPLDSVDRA